VTLYFKLAGTLEEIHLVRSFLISKKILFTLVKGRLAALPALGKYQKIISQEVSNSILALEVPPKVGAGQMVC
jgi:hypothetical protein